MLGDQTYKVHRDGYDQTEMLTGQGSSKRHEVWYFAQTKLGALRMDNYKYQFIDQPQGWIGPTVYPNMPKLTNLRQDPFERMNCPSNGFSGGSIGYYDSFKHEMWRFQIPAQVIAKYLPSFINLTRSIFPLALACYFQEQTKAHPRQALSRPCGALTDTPGKVRRQSQTFPDTATIITS
jgi:hypothetical protein